MKSVPVSVMNGLAKRQVTDSDTSSDCEANASAFACYVTHDSGSSLDINSE